ncbi:MAG: SH3 domain-containing protein [Lachnospiraceae bacterium]|nr:SH3 domain-containing protein [Lachnospiraceae bacterium]
MYCDVCGKETKSTAFCPYCGKRLGAEGAAHHLKPGTVIGGKYRIEDFIGEGGFGITYIGRDTNLDMPVAIKEYYPCGFAGRDSSDSNSVRVTAADKESFFENGKKRFLQEARSLAKFSKEPGIVTVRDYFEENDTAYIAMEYLEGENLGKYAERNGGMDADELINRMIPLMRSLEKIHEAGVIHRDISPDNIMFQKNGTLKLMDFGSARYFTNNESEMSVILKQGFSPEEQYRKKGDQGPWTDVYSLCATIYSCVTGVIPESALDRLHNDALKPPSQMGVKISAMHENALMTGLAVLPENRCKSVAELMERFGVDAVREDGKGKSVDPYKTYMAEDMSHEGRGYEGESQRQPQRNRPRFNVTAVVVAACACGVLAMATLAMVVFPKFLKKETKPEGTKTEEAKETVQASATDSSKKKKKTAVAAPKETDILVPDVIGLRSSEATEKLAGEGLKVNIIQAESESVEADYVISQSPVAEKKAKQEDVVTVYVSISSHASAPAAASGEAAQSAVAAKTLYCRASEFATLRASASTGGAEIAKVGCGEGVQYLDVNGEFYYVTYKGQSGYVLKDFFSEDPNAAINYSESASVPTPGYATYYCCASISATLRSTASRSGADLAQISSREAVQCVGAEGEFYKVIYKGQNGYVLKDFFSQDPNAPLNYDSGNAPSSSSDPAIYYCCASESATLRSAPSRSGAELANVNSREAVQFISDAGEFYYVSYQGQNGYVLKNYFSTDPNAELNYGRN